MLEKLDSKLQNTCLPRYTSAVRSKKKGGGVDHRSKIEHCTVSQSVSQHERENRKPRLPELHTE